MPSREEGGKFDLLTELGSKKGPQVARFFRAICGRFGKEQQEQNALTWGKMSSLTLYCNLKLAPACGIKTQRPKLAQDCIAALPLVFEACNI